MITVYIEYNAETRLMAVTDVSTGGADNAVATTGDNLTTELQFTFNDPQHILDGFGARLDFDVWITDADGHAYRPFILLDEQKKVTLPSEILSNVKCGVLPIQLVFSEVDGEEEIVQQSLNLIYLAINQQLDATAESPVERYPQASDAIMNVEYDESTYTLTFQRIDGALITVALSDISEEHFEVQHYADLETLTEADAGDTATVLDTGIWYKLYIQYGNRVWFAMSGNVTINGQQTGSPVFYAPFLSGTSGQYLESRGENQSPVYVDKITQIQDSDSLATASQVKTYTDAETTRAVQQEQTIASDLSDEITRQKGQEQTIASDLSDEVTRQKGQESALSSAIADEEARQKGQESGLSSAIADEETRQKGQEQQLSTAISDEVTRATGQEQQLSTAISDEETRQKGQESVLSTAISDETTRATGQEQQLSTAISDEVTRQKGQESVLSSAISDEETRQKGQESELSTAISNEVTRQKGQESVLSTAISDEETRQKGQESGLSSAISDEETRQKGQESGLSSAISDEETRQKGQESELSTAISNEEIRQTAQENTKADKTTTVNGHPLSQNVTVTKSDVGLGNVDNTSDADKPVSTATQTALDQKLDDTQLVTSWGSATSDSKIPSEKLVKTQIDTEVQRATLAESTKRDKITAQHTSNPVAYTQSYDSQTQQYNEGLHDITDNTTGGTVPIRNSVGKLTSAITSDGDADTIVSTKGYTDSKNALKVDKASIVTDWQSVSDNSHIPSELLAKTKIGNVQTNLDTHTQNTSNPHSVTQAQVGLGNVDNTADLDKPISTATQSALDGKQSTLVSGNNIKTINDGSILGSGNIALQTPLTAGSDYVQHKNTASRIYATDLSAVDTLLAYSQQADQMHIVQRQSNGNITVPQTPVQDTDQASKGFVNSSIGTATANFLGTYDATTDLGLTVTEDPTTHEILTPTNAQIQAVLNDGTTVHYPSAPTNNDYVFISLNKPSTTDTDEFRRFKFNGTSWDYEYTLNNSSFTQAQWDAISSGINATKVSTYDTHVASTSNPHHVTQSQLGLGNVTNVSTTSQITSGSPSNVTSGQVYSALLDKLDNVSQTGDGYVSDIQVDSVDKTKLNVTRTQIPQISVDDTDTGNVVTDVTQSGHGITLTRGVNVGQDIPSPTSSDVGKVLQAVQNGNDIVLDYEVGGLVDDVEVNGSSVVSNKIANITVPTKTSDLQNDSGFITGLGFDDLSSHPTTLQGYGITDAKIESGVITLGNDTITPVTDISGKADKQNTVTNVSYNSSSRKIQQTINSIVSDVMTLQSIATSGSYADLTNNPISTTDVDSEKYLKFNNTNVLVDHQKNADTQAQCSGNQDSATTQAQCSGNQATATKLKTARNINVQDADGTNTGTQASFDGSGNVTMKLPATIKASITGNCSGSAGSVAWNNVSSKPNLPTVNTTSSVQPSGALQNGFYYVKSSVNSLSGADANPFLQYHTSNNDFRILTTAYSNSWLQQVATDFRTIYIYIRRCENGTWSDWTLVNPSVLPVQNGGTGNSSVDTTPTANSTKMVTSGGVKTALDKRVLMSDISWNAGGLGNWGTITQSGGYQYVASLWARDNGSHDPGAVEVSYKYDSASGQGSNYVQIDGFYYQDVGRYKVVDENSIRSLQQGSATKLATARTFRTNLGSTSTASFDGSGNVTPGVTGTLAVGNGGTGNTSVDTTPTSGSSKMCTSGGIYNARWRLLYQWTGSLQSGGSVSLNYGSTVYNYREHALIYFCFYNTSSTHTKQWVSAPYVVGDAIFTGIDTEDYWNNSTPHLFGWCVNWGTGTGNQTVRINGSKHCFVSSEGNTNWSDNSFERLVEFRIYGAQLA